MAKKNLKYFIPGAIALVLGIVAFCMMFLPAVKFTVDSMGFSEDGWTGAQIAFGYKESIANQDITILNFNFLAFLAFLLPVIGGLLALIFKNGLITKILTTACFVVGAVLLFSMVALSGMGRALLADDDLLSGVVNPILNAIYGAIDDTKSLGVGPIVAGVVSVIGAVVCFFKGTIAKMFK